MLSIVPKLTILDVCVDPSYTWKVQHEPRATGKNCNMQRVQQEEHAKTKTMQPVKVQHETDQYIETVQHEEKCNIKILLHKKVQHGNNAV